MVDLWRDFWIRETGTGQQVAQLRDRYTMMMMMAAAAMVTMMMVVVVVMMMFGWHMDVNCTAEFFSIVTILRVRVLTCSCYQVNVPWLIIPTNLALPSTVNNQKEMLDFKNNTGSLLFVSCFHGVIPEFGCPYQLNLPSQESIRIVLYKDPNCSWCKHFILFLIWHVCAQV